MGKEGLSRPIAHRCKREPDTFSIRLVDGCCAETALDGHDASLSDAASLCCRTNVRNGSKAVIALEPESRHWAVARGVWAASPRAGAPFRFRITLDVRKSVRFRPPLTGGGPLIAAFLTMTIL